MKKTVFIIGFCLMSFFGFGQLEINAELRPRGEVRHGYKAIPKEDKDAAIFISQRTRLNLYYSHSKFKVGLAFQDVRVWGDEQIFTATGSFGDNASIDMNEGWIEIFAGKLNSFKIGRQYWVYEDERLFSKRNWNQHSIKYDGLLYKYEPEKIKIHLGFSLNNSADNLVGNDYTLYKEEYFYDDVNDTLIIVKKPLESRLKSQNFIYISKKINDRLDFSFQALATGFHKQESANTIYVKGTYGLYINYKPGIFSVKANGFYQNGKNINGQEVNAYFAHLKGIVKLDPVSLNAGVDYHSGQDQVKEKNNYQDKDHFFDLFYGVRHRFYGYMDLFENLSRASRNGGLVDIYTGLVYNVSKSVVLSLDYHYFRLESRVYDPFITDQILDKSLGSEIDLTMDVTIIPEIVITSGFSTMFATSSMEQLQRSAQKFSQNENLGTSYWGYVMITAKPKLFKSDK